MNYKETLFFIGKCLTITHEKDNRILVEKELKSDTINWDNIVKITTGHYVFPALYCNLKRADFLHYLPEDLVEYMKYITDLNRDRNQQIIKEAKEINTLLLANNITPIFLKGTGNLLEGLYQDIAERMVGDADILVNNNNFRKAIRVLKENGYSEKSENFVDNTLVNRHYPKLTKKGKITAIEVHYKMVRNEKGFSYNDVKNSLKTLKDTTTILSYNNQLLLTCFNKQINDRGQWTKSIAFRNFYDVYLLSKFTDTETVISNFKHSEADYLNNFIASCSYFFNAPISLKYTKTKQAEKFVKKQVSLIKKPKIFNLNKNFWLSYFMTKETLSVTIRAFYLKEYRTYIFDRIKELKTSKQN
ncbi:nucleotidyltransferase family protein [Tenacibaculum piscium]|uniref:nucleotidyltransferase domain-containing protein n=1 Tax=Tenacibaculum piscium TaxID=1458515 RepID=UPI001EFBD660|nr:nucleotidyltransferase family protein [Tenacibaculum piscium]MCG8183534.1 nucleotidyltransferase family protein [Tenacibaculum piscium]MCG8204979.1 nucleotidyltransferase family protein [Tenacibaculum piscium]